MPVTDATQHNTANDPDVLHSAWDRANPGTESQSEMADPSLHTASIQTTGRRVLRALCAEKGQAGAVGRVLHVGDGRRQNIAKIGGAGKEKVDPIDTWDGICWRES